MQSGSMQFMNGQPPRGYGPPAPGFQGYPGGPPAGPVGPRPVGPGHQVPGGMPPTQWGPPQPGGPPGPQQMKGPPPPNSQMHNGGFPGQQSDFPPPSGGMPPNAGQMPPSVGRMPPPPTGGRMPPPPASSGPMPPPVAAGGGYMPPSVPPGEFHRPPPPAAAQPHQMQGGGQVPAQRSMPPPPGPAAYQQQQQQPLESQMDAMNISASNAGSSWQGQAGPPSGQQNSYQPRPPQSWGPPPPMQRPPGPGAMPPPPPPSSSAGSSPPAGNYPGFTSGPPQQGPPMMYNSQVQPRAAGPPPPGASAGPPQMGQQQPPPQNLPPVNPGPQTMMNMGFGSPSDSPTLTYPGQGGNAPQYGAPGQYGPQPPHAPMNAAQAAGYNYQQQQRMAHPTSGPAPPAMSAPAAQPQPRRLDPDQMPSPIQVMEDDKRNRAGVFQTDQKGAVPPLVTTSFTVEDRGICSPRFLRSTMYNIPCTGDLLKQTHVPFALSLTPFARPDITEAPLPIVDLGQMGPVRCNRCKAYMCPLMVFTDGGRKFQCSFCTCNTEVPPEYFNHLDHTGRRVDCYDRPELCLGAYEFVATTDYCKEGKLPNAPAYIFMIDVSYNSVKSGLVNLLCTRLKALLAELPKDAEDEESEIRVGFVTYSNVLHFYNIKAVLAQPQMLVVSDVQDVFVPLLDGFLVKVSESEAMIDMLLSQIAVTFSDSRQTEVVLGPVIQAGLDALRSANRSGKLFIFHSSLPTMEAPGKLKSRDDRNLLGTDKEKTLLTPQTNFYTKLGQECVAAGCSVDLFLFPNSYIDIATVAEVPRLTGGSVHKYSYFQADLGGDMVVNDLRTAITGTSAFDVVIRVRTSTGIRAVDFYGNFYMSNTTDVELAAVSCDSCLAVEIKHDDRLSEAEGACAQAAVLYTSVGGRRRLRVLNVAFNCCTQVADLFRSCELDTYINFTAKQAIRECLNSHSRQVRENLTQQCAQILACYRKNCASPSSSGQLILPECMKLLPVYINSVIKSGILQSGEIATDDRSYEMHLLNAMDVASTNVYFYPRLIPIHDVDVDDTSMPTPVRCSYERLRENGVYLLDNGLILFMWIGLGINSDWIRDVLGVASVAQVDIDKTRLQDLDNALSVRIRSIVKMIRSERRRHMKLVIIRQRDKLEPVFLHYLTEDRGSGNTTSYVDFLCHIHKEIRTLLS